MDKPKATPKDFFLWAGAMVSLYGGTVAFINLIFDYINYAFPDALSYYYNPYQGSVAYEMSLLGEQASPSLDRVTPGAWWRSYRRSYDSPG